MTSPMMPNSRLAITANHERRDWDWLMNARESRVLALECCRTGASLDYDLSRLRPIWSFTDSTRHSGNNRCADSVSHRTPDG